MKDSKLSLADCWRLAANLLNPGGYLPERSLRLSAEHSNHLFHFLSAHLVAPSVFAGLSADMDVPEEFRRGLRVLHDLTVEQNGRLRQILLDSVLALNSADITPMPLKGAIALLPGQYPYADRRVIGDLDIAVPPHRLPEAVKALLGAGFFFRPALDPVEAARMGGHHLPPLFHPSGYGWVELHRAFTRVRAADPILSFSLVSEAAEVLDWHGGSIAIPSLEHRLVHSSVHQHLQDQVWVTDRRSMRPMLEFARLNNELQAANINWCRLLEPLDAAGIGNAVRLDLLGSSNLFGLPLPPEVKLNRQVLAIEGRFWSRLASPSFNSFMEFVTRGKLFSRRLPNLPRRLMTPSWYPRKWAQIRRRLASHGLI